MNQVSPVLIKIPGFSPAPQTTFPGHSCNRTTVKFKDEQQLLIIKMLKNIQGAQSGISSQQT